MAFVTVPVLGSKATSALSSSSWIQSLPATSASTPTRTPSTIYMHAKENEKPLGFFDSLMKKLIQTPGVKNAGLEPCPFCDETGIMKCEACLGTGKDALGTCLLCEGKGKLTCGICNGIGKVDVVRRGGTDTKGQFLSKAKKEARAAAAAKKAAVGAVTVVEDEEITETGVVYVCDRESAGFSKLCSCYSHPTHRPNVYYQGEGPFEVPLKAGKTTSLCACGHSTMQPYCGGVHNSYNKEHGTSFQPIRETSDVDKLLNACRCGHSKKRPYCDGTHAVLRALNE
mmetsp:Transcript_14285/g.24504  ORF Transcript_14285/g.24504 Transcript_14285/m.24504 type:complete len:284 (-) Transcript_14285:162-1013(-)